MGFFGFHFWSRNFLGVLLEALRIFLSFEFCPHSIIPVTWNPEYPQPWGEGELIHKGCWFDILYVHVWPMRWAPFWGTPVIIACVQTITKLWLVPSAKQRRDPCSEPPTDSTNYRKCVSNFPSTWLAITTNKTKAFFNWPIVACTQIWVHSWKSRTRISALFRRWS